MTVKEIGTKLVEFCSKGQNIDAINTLYADNITSVEAADSPGNPDMPRVMEGKQNIIGKNQWWYDNHEVHNASVKGPFPHGEDKFATVFSFDVTFKPANQRMQMEEVAIYTVKDQKIVREEFFYDMG